MKDIIEKIQDCLIRRFELPSKTALDEAEEIYQEIKKEDPIGWYTKDMPNWCNYITVDKDGMIGFHEKKPILFFNTEWKSDGLHFTFYLDKKNPSIIEVYK